MIFWDMDCVMTDWLHGALSLFNVTLEDFNEAVQEHRRKTGHRPGWEITNQLVGGQEVLWTEINSRGEDFWYNLLPLPAAGEIRAVMARLRHSGLNQSITVLSSPGHGTFGVWEGKKRWLLEHMGVAFADHLVLCPSEKKALLAGPGRWLVDDKKETCEDWIKAGGSAIHWPAPPAFNDYPRADECAGLLSPMIRSFFGTRT